MVELLYREETGKTLKGYYVVYNGTSHNYPEYIYENGLVKVMDKAQVHYRRQPEYQITYKGFIVGAQRLDILLWEANVVVECKVVLELEKIHKAQLFSYMKTVGAQVGLLLNFGGPEPEFKRLSFIVLVADDKVPIDNCRYPNAKYNTQGNS